MCWAVLVLLASACTDRPAGPSQASTYATPIPIQDCPITEHHDEPLPEPFSATINGPTIWMGGPDAFAVLFYAQGGNDLTIGTNGTNGLGVNSKILWLVDGKPDGPLTMDAINLTSGTEITQEVDGGGSFPSIPVLPDEGCWRIAISVEGSERLTIVVPATHRPS